MPAQQGMPGNVYLIVVGANVFLTLGNALLGKKFGNYNVFNIVCVLWAGKLIIGSLCYGFLRTDSVFSIPWQHLLAILGIGMLLGVGEGLLFGGLSKDVSVVATLGCLYPILLTVWAWMLTGERPNMYILLAIVLSSAAIACAALGTQSPAQPPTLPPQ